MPKMTREDATLLLIDFQQRLMPAIDSGAERVANAARLLVSARKLGIPRLFTEQNPRGLGPTLPELAPLNDPCFAKMTFDATQDPLIGSALKDAEEVVVVGSETHVCVLQTVQSLLAHRHPVYVVADAVGSRTAANYAAGLARMQAMGAEIVTTEMVIFEWLGSAESPHFKELIALIK